MLGDLSQPLLVCGVPSWNVSLWRRLSESTFTETPMGEDQVRRNWVIRVEILRFDCWIATSAEIAPFRIPYLCGGHWCLSGSVISADASVVSVVDV